MIGNGIEGERIRLRPLTPTDAEGAYLEWLNDPRVTEFNSHGEIIYTKDLAKEYIEEVRESTSTIVWAVIAIDSGAHIGNISLQEMSERDRSAEFAILMGDTSYWGKGYSKEAMRLVLTEGFSNLKLHRIYCGTSEKNMAMQKLALSIGMREEGRRREAQFKNGSFNDIVEYGILESEWKK